MKKVHLFIILVCLFTISCEKNNSDTSSSSSLLLGKWKITGYINNKGYDYFNTTMPACEKDNIITYSTGNVVTLDEGNIKCNSGDPQMFSKTIIIPNPILNDDINTYSGSRFDDEVGFINLSATPAREVILLNQTTFKLYYESPAGTFWTITYTRQP